MSEDDVKLAKKVVKDVFGSNRPAPTRAKTKAELNERLWLAHTLLNVLLVGDAGDGGLAQPWSQQIEEIEERVNDLRNAVAQAR